MIGQFVVSPFESSDATRVIGIEVGSTWQEWDRGLIAYLDTDGVRQTISESEARLLDLSETLLLIARLRAEGLSVPRSDMAMIHDAVYGR